MYPSQESHYAGIYVKNQYDYLKSNYKDHVFTIKAMQKVKTGFLGSIMKYISFLGSSISYLLRKYEIVHVHYFSFHFAFAVLYKIFHPGTKIVLTFHGSDVNMFSENMVLRRFANLLFRITRTITICVGMKLADNFHKKFFMKADHIIAAGLDDDVFVYNKNAEKKYDLTFVGTFSKLKGFDLIYEAITKYKLDYKWCFIGAGLYYEDLKKLQNEFNISIFSGFTHKDIAEKLNESRFFIIPSRSEGFPLASIEALYCGVPVICSDLDQFKEQVREGENGFIIDQSTSESIRDTIRKAFAVSGQDYEKLSSNAASSNKEFTLKNVCSELVKIYKNGKA